MVWVLSLACSRAPLTVSDVDVLVGKEAVLSATPEGRYRWTLREAPLLSDVALAEGRASELRFVPDRPGVYVVDVDAGDRSATALVTAVATEDRPVADAGDDRVVVVGSDVVLLGDGSYDPGGLPLVYDWRLTSAPPDSAAALTDAQSSRVSFPADVLGTYLVELLVFNGSQVSEPATVAVEAIAAPPIDTGDVPNGVFNPDEVYLYGTVAPGSAGTDAVAHWSDPFVGTAGFPIAFEPRPQLRPDGVLLYRSGGVREFHCDGCPDWAQGDPYPEGVADNDPVIPTPPCADPDDFLVGVDGTVLAKCNNAWWDATGAKVLPDGRALLSFGHDRVVLDAEGRLFDLDARTDSDVSGLPDGILFTARAQPGGFWVAAGPSEADIALWFVDAQAATASLVGEYPAVPAGLYPRSSVRLDASGALLQDSAAVVGFEDAVTRRRIDGLSEVVYTEGASPTPWVQLHGIDPFVTGP